MSEERRRHPRFELFSQVRVVRGRIDYVMEVIDISRGGIRIDIGKELRPGWLSLGSDVELRVLIEDAPIEVVGKVVRIEETTERRTFAVQLTTLLEEEAVRRACKAAGRPPPLPQAPGGESSESSAPGDSTT